MALDTTYRPGDTVPNLLAKILVLFGGSPTGGDGIPQLLKQILQSASSAGGETLETITYAASVALDFSTDSYKTISLTGNLALTSANLAAVRSIAVRIVADGSTRTLSFPASWIFLEGTKPTNIAANKTGVLSLTAFGTTDGDVIAAWAVEQ